MANDRMFLLYRPTGEAVFLGKCMGGRWYGTPEEVHLRIETLFARAEYAWLAGAAKDDFVLLKESDKVRWRYKEGADAEGVVKIEFEAEPDA